jgi:(S)-ureidoglycine aminohydrolase
MAPPTYASPMAGLPDQTALHTGRAVFTEAYALIPRGVMRDIVTSYLPHWNGPAPGSSPGR